MPKSNSLHLMQRLTDTKATLDIIMLQIENYLQHKVEFSHDFSVEFTPSDGFVLQQGSNNAPLHQCLFVAEKKGMLTYDEYMEMCI